MYRIGTAHFPYLCDALDYYAPQHAGFTYDELRAAVVHKIEVGEIHLGPPPRRDGWRAVLVDEDPGRRYHLEQV